MYGHARRALFDKSAARLRDDTNKACEADAADCQYRRKRLRRRQFRYSRNVRSMRIRCRCDPSMAAESALRGL
jgi:hypothetical protein